MYEEDDNVQLISNKPRKDANGDPFEETTVFSDSLYGDSLPSMRAQLAATQMQSRGRRTQEVDSSENEGKFLLGTDKSRGEGSVTTVVENSIKKEKKEANGHGQYSSLEGGIVVTSKKRAKKEIITKL